MAALIEVYRIDAFESKGNSHCVGSRHENWYVRRDKEFTTDAEARAYVREMNIKCTPLVTYMAAEKDPQKRSEFVDHFCFAEDRLYLYEQRYFLGRPPMDAIRESLKANSVVII